MAFHTVGRLRQMLSVSQAVVAARLEEFSHSCAACCAKTMNDLCLIVRAGYLQTSALAVLPRNKYVYQCMQVHFDCLYKGIDVASSRSARLLGGNRTIAEVTLLMHKGRHTLP